MPDKQPNMIPVARLSDVMVDESGWVLVPEDRLETPHHFDLGPPNWPERALVSILVSSGVGLGVSAMLKDHPSYLVSQGLPILVAGLSGWAAYFTVDPEGMGRKT